MIDFDNVADRIEALPLPRGNYRGLAAGKDALFYLDADEGDFNRFEFRAVTSMDLHAFSFKDASRLLRNSTYAMACLATFTVFFQRSGIRTNMISLYGADVLGLDEVAIGTIISYSTLTNLLLTVPMGYAIDLLGRKPVIVFNMFIMAVANVAFVYAGSYWGMAAAAAVLGIASAGAGQAPLALATDASYNERRGLAMGVYRLIGDVGSMLGPIVLSAIADYTDLRTPFFVMSGILVLSAVMVGVIAKEVIATRLGKGTGLGGPRAEDPKA